MKRNLKILAVAAIAVAVGMGTTLAATNDVSTKLQQGLFEEEANRNLDAAIQWYQAVVTQTDKDRQYGATALFRLGECYRKQGKTNEANAQYERVIREFPEQTDLVKLSREYVHVPSDFQSRLEEKIRSAPKAPEAPFATNITPPIQSIEELGQLPPDQRALAVQEMFPSIVLTGLLDQKLRTEQELSMLSKNFGSGHPDYVAKKSLLETIERQIQERVDTTLAVQKNLALARLKNSSNAPSEPTARQSVSQQKENEELRKLQAAIKDSPDLVNARDARDQNITPLFKAAEYDYPSLAQFLLDNKAEIESRCPFVITAWNGDGTATMWRGDFTPLLVAAEYGHEKILKMLIDHGANVNATVANTRDGNGTRYLDGMTALHFAAMSDSKDSVEALLAHGADVNAENGEGKTPLFFAAEKGFKAVVELLLSHGATVNPESRANPLQAAAGVGNKAIVEVLLDHRANANAKNEKGETALFTAAENGYEAIVQAMISRGADVNIATKSGITPLMATIQRNRTDMVEMLLAHGADPNTKTAKAYNSTPNDWAALHFAVVGDHVVSAKALLEKGADVDITGFVIAPPNFAMSNSHVDHNVTSLMLAVDENKKDMAQLLIDHKANVNFRNDLGETPLLIAVQGQNKELVELLLNHGANANTLDGGGWSMLFHAAYRKQKEIAEALLTHGADPNVRVSRTNGTMVVTGWTALHCAAENKQLEMAELLIAHGADVNAQTSYGTTPLALALDNKKIVELLLAHGADVNMPNNSGLAPLDMINGGSNEVSELLRNHGAFSAIERNTIRVSRNTTIHPVPLFWSDPKRYNHYTLFEAIAFSYPSQAGVPGNLEMKGLSFPDFEHVQIRRLSPKGTNILKVNLESIFESGDCSKDMPLNWGDIVDIPELDHNLSESWSGLKPAVIDALKKCLARRVDIIVKGNVTHITLAPNPMHMSYPIQMRIGPGGRPFSSPPFNVNNAIIGSESVPVTNLNNFFLSSAVRDARVILASSDMTHVTLRRKDSATGKDREIVLNLEDTTSTENVLLEDGDVIEIPEKQ